MNKIIDFIKNNQSIAIVSHVSPDGDTIGSALALFLFIKKLGKDCSVHCLDDISKDFSYLPSINSYEKLDAIKKDAIITVDCADFMRSGLTKEDIANKNTMNIDHHILANDNYMDVNYVRKASATCLIVYEIISSIDKSIIDKDIATCLYVGISTDTNNFTNGGTSGEAFTTTGELCSYGIVVPQLTKIIYRTRTLGKTKAIGRVINNLKLYKNNLLAISYLTQKDMDEINILPTELDGIIEYLCDIEDVSVGVFIKETAPDSFKISFRSNNEVNVSEICQINGGGGHKKAAGCSLSGSLDQVIEKVLSQVVFN